ncbi:DUF732 domain-containing protein [Gordonia sp. VNK21]|uniref:DUF732 domain-containing protein n=1 Tax=Gordonia sp. VNK21 TaxID=3382483 RepID=UPI0038D4273A
MIAARHRLLMLPLAAAAALLLGACGDDSSDDSAAASTTPSSGEGTFLQILQASGVDISDRDALIAEGKQICADLKAGTPITEVIDGQGQDAVRSAAMSSAAVVGLCPDQQDKLLPSNVPSGMPTLPSQ